MFDSSKVTVSPILNLVWVRYTISTWVAEVLFVICAIAPLTDPIIFSPRMDVVSKLNPDMNVNLSKEGAEVSTDSKTPTTLTTSGTFNDISLSSTLKP